ncbi:MAG TPA: VanW family protein [Gaiellaceae bacterium]
MRLEAGVTHSSYYVRRRRQARVRRIRRLFLAALVVFAVAAAIVYAGSPRTIAQGIEIEGIDVGGLSAAEAKVALARRSHGVLAKPVRFVAGGRTFELKASDIRLRPDWAASIASAQHAGDGFGPLRGFRRLKVRLFPVNLSAKATYDQAALNATLARIAKRIDRPHREAAVVLHGLRPAIAPDRAGSVLDRDASARTIVAALASLSRGRSVSLPLKVDKPRVTGSMLAPTLAKAQVAVSRPVVLTLGPTRYKLPRWRVAQLLKLPAGGATTLRMGGPGADAYFKRLQKVVDTPAHDAEFLVISGGITIKPASEGRVVDVPKTADALLAAALRPVNRVTPIAVATQPPSRTTAEAQAMGINGIVGSYTTSYGGVPNRIHNVQVVSHLVDDTLIGPGKEFSFNNTTGDRNAAKGLLEAPVIISGELQTGLGGGTCQVSTTVFNAAYEAGLPITARTNHALYISHYPQGRDATVNYPDIDLKFVNDTDHWLLLRTFISASTLTVNLYGTPQHRRVESEVKPLETTGPVPTVITNDPKLLKGKKVVDETGSAPQSTSVTRRVYDENGKLLYESTWYSSYVGEKEKIRVGTKKPPQPKPKPVVPRFGLPPELVPVDTTAVPTTPTAVPTAPTG